MSSGPTSSVTKWPPFNAIVVSLMDIYQLDTAQIESFSYEKRLEELKKHSGCRYYEDGKQTKCTRNCPHMFDYDMEIFPNQRLKCNLWGSRCKVSVSILNKMRSIEFYVPDKKERISWLGLCMYTIYLNNREHITEVNVLKEKLTKKIGYYIDLHSAVYKAIWAELQKIIETPCDGIDSYVKTVTVKLLCHAADKQNNERKMKNIYK